MKLAAALALATAAFVLCAGASLAGTAPRTEHRILGISPRAAHTSPIAAPRHAPKPHRFNCVASCSLYEGTINQYFTDVAADPANTTSSVYSVLPQYLAAQPFTTTFDPVANTYVDASPFPTNHTCQDGYDAYCVTKAQVEAEISKVIAAKGWPAQSQTALYFLFTPAKVGVCVHGGTSKYNECTTNAFCAFHSATSSFIYAVEPDALAVSRHGCDTGEAPAGNGADSTLSTISHEEIEAITDPLGTGWWTEDPETFQNIPNAFYGNEIGDLCAWNFGTALGGTPGTFLTEGTEWNQVINGHNYWLQQEWSNADSGCVQYAGGPFTNFSPSDQLYEGTGPLVNHTGPVMTSTAVYAIYWVPAAPAGNTHIPPRVIGPTHAGKKLKALHGAWTYALAYEYRWLRCSATGRSCKQIKKATNSTYVLTPADAGHRIEVRVTATNQAGRVGATSLPTAKVRS